MDKNPLIISVFTLTLSKNFFIKIQIAYLMTITEAFGDIADIIAQMNPDKIVGLKASKPMSDRVEYLVYKK